MKLLYMGTAAAEGIPALFCSCPLCTYAKEHGDKDVRTRCQALINEDLLLDFGPDTYAHYLKYQFPLPELETLLVTHDHIDHFFPEDLSFRSPAFASPRKSKLTIYGSDAVAAHFTRVTPTNLEADTVLDFQTISPFTKVEHPRYDIFSLRALHDRTKTCLFYSIQEKETGKSILYGHDSGFFPEDSWDFLKTLGTVYDLVSLDCTYMLNAEGSNHMGYPDDKKVINKMKELGLADAHTQFVINHFSHHQGKTHEELVCAVQEDGVLVAYDGLIVEI